MSNSTYFVRGCPTCGRRLHVRVEYLGRNVVCQHCGRRFVATDPANVYDGDHEPDDATLRRAEELLRGLSKESA